MNDTDSQQADSDAELQALLSNAGTRPQPSAEAEQAAFNKLHAAWQTKVAEHKKQQQRRWLSIASAAAAVVLAVFATTVWTPQQAGEWQVQLAAGSIKLADQPLTAPQIFMPAQNQTLHAVAPTRLVSSQGADLRLAQGTTVHWLDQTNLQLDAGRIYVDTKDLSDFSISTEFGTVRDIGTRYMVDLNTNRLSVAVREGATEIASEFGQHTAHAKPMMAAIVHVDRSGLEIDVEPTSDQRWNWIHEVSSGYSERTVPALLSAIGRDLGKQVSYASHGVEATVANATVAGTLTGLAPREALQLVARSAELDWQEAENTIVIDFHQPM